MPKKTYEIPSKCPPQLKALIEHFGTKEKAHRMIHVDKQTFTRVVNGGEPMPDNWVQRVERALRGEGQEGEAPKFVPWDGTTRAWSMRGRNGGKGRSFKKVPSMLVDLLDKNDGNISKTARACGTTGNSITTIIEGKVEFSDKRQRMVFGGLHGIPVADGDVEGPDEFKLGMAIVQVPAKNYDRVRDMALLLHGRVLFKTSTAVGWVVIYAIKGNDAKMFKRLAERDCSKIVCP